MLSLSPLILICCIGAENEVVWKKRNERWAIVVPLACHNVRCSQQQLCFSCVWLCVVFVSHHLAPLMMMWFCRPWNVFCFVSPIGWERTCTCQIITRPCGRALHLPHAATIDNKTVSLCVCYITLIVYRKRVGGGWNERGLIVINIIPLPFWLSIESLFVFSPSTWIFGPRHYLSAAFWKVIDGWWMRFTCGGGEENWFRDPLDGMFVTWGNFK